MKKSAKPIKAIKDKKRETPKRGTYVSRAAFTTLQMENRKLKEHIHTLVMGSIPDVIFLKAKYRKEFGADDMFFKELKVEAIKSFNSKLSEL